MSDNPKVFSDELIAMLETKEKDNFIGDILTRFVDGEPKNINPLTKIPEPQMRLYGFYGAFSSSFFDREFELLDWVRNHNNTDFGDVCVIDFLGNVAGRSDVIRITFKDGKSNLYAHVD